MVHLPLPPDPAPLFGPDWNSVDVSIYYYGKTYVPALHNLNGLAASVVNGKARYALPDGWFANYNNAADSVLVNGNFSRP